MKVLILNGSPRQDGNTSIAIREMVKIFEAEKFRLRNLNRHYRSFGKLITKVEK